MATIMSQGTAGPESVIGGRTVRSCLRGPCGSFGRVAASGNSTGVGCSIDSVIDDYVGRASSNEMDAINAFNGRLRANGHWVFAGGLGAPLGLTVIDNRGAEPIVTDGPFVESKEYLAGFWIIEAPDLDVALRLAAEGSKHCNRKVEVRPFLLGYRESGEAAQAPANGPTEMVEQGLELGARALL